MLLSDKTLEELRIIINGDNTPDYRKGYQLVDFFNSLGFHDTYGQGFPSRWVYTDEKLRAINGTPELDKCITKVFAVINYIDRIDQLDSYIANFNKYLAFDKWKVIRNNDLITFKKLDKVIIETPKKEETVTESEFLSHRFEMDINLLGLENSLSEIIKIRLKETEQCVNNDAPLSSVIMIGSILEGVLLGIASSNPRLFNQAQSAPKDEDGKVRKFQDWTLNSFIDVAFEIGFIKRDVKKFSHAVRDFRNYIHPYSQMATSFNPDKNTALICFQVLKAAISQIGEYRKNMQGGHSQWTK